MNYELLGQLLDSFQLGGTVKSRAPVIVGEAGPELALLPPGSQIKSNDSIETQLAMLNPKIPGMQTGGNVLAIPETPDPNALAVPPTTNPGGINPQGMMALISLLGQLGGALSQPGSIGSRVGPAAAQAVQAPLAAQARQTALAQPQIQNNAPSNNVVGQPSASIATQAPTSQRNSELKQPANFTPAPGGNQPVAQTPAAPQAPVAQQPGLNPWLLLGLDPQLASDAQASVDTTLNRQQRAQEFQQTQALEQERVAQADRRLSQDDTQIQMAQEQHPLQMQQMQQELDNARTPEQKAEIELRMRNASTEFEAQQRLSTQLELIKAEADVRQAPQVWSRDPDTGIRYNQATGAVEFPTDEEKQQIQSMLPKNSKDLNLSQKRLVAIRNNRSEIEEALGVDTEFGTDESGEELNFNNFNEVVEKLQAAGKVDLANKLLEEAGEPTIKTKTASPTTSSGQKLTPIQIDMYRRAGRQIPTGN